MASVRRLSEAGRPSGISLPAYDRKDRRTGIVHFGLGAFARAHMAWYTDRVMALAEGDWMIAGVSLRSAAVGEQLNPQDGLYALAEKSGDGMELQVIGSLREVLLAPAQRGAVVAVLSAPSTTIVTFTVTEKGYCRKADGSLDFAQAEEGFYPILAEALAQRAAAGCSGLTLLSCDNLASNGDQLRSLLGELIAVRNPNLTDWVDAHCTFPCAMIDRIVPATTDIDRTEAEALLGLRDEGLVVTEPFSQWIIEDRFAAARPAWELAGAEIVEQVAPYEAAKLRMLNGAHSLLAYCGLQAGYSYVHEAVADAGLRALAERLMRSEAAPTIAAAPGQDLGAYADALLARFANPALNHRLAQIAMDGSQKIPQRWLETLAANRRAGRSCPAILSGLAAWLRHLRGDNGLVDDPRAAELEEYWVKFGITEIAAALFGPGGAMASEWVPDEADCSAVAAALAAARVQPID